MWNRTKERERERERERYKETAIERGEIKRMGSAENRWLPMRRRACREPAARRVGREPLEESRGQLNYFLGPLNNTGHALMPRNASSSCVTRRDNRVILFVEIGSRQSGSLPKLSTRLSLVYDVFTLVRLLVRALIPGKLVFTLFANESKFNREVTR